ncbi:Uncharacterised protein [Pasteurella multocida subsp. septica]|nr:Uncharacterised protein [Pasteurella multocida subsp. septica]
MKSYCTFLPCLLFKQKVYLLYTFLYILYIQKYIFTYNKLYLIYFIFNKLHYLVWSDECLIDHNADES